MRNGWEETFAGKSGWCEGPWLVEPDLRTWIYGDVPCMVRRNDEVTGALCGYVAVPPGHPWHERDYELIDADVHGGLTWASGHRPPNWDWVPRPDTPDGTGFLAALREAPDDQTARQVYADWLRDRGRDWDAELLLAAPSWWWVGFDCSHAGDFCPAMEARLPDHLRHGARLGEVYRDLAYVVKETRGLARLAQRVAEEGTGT